MIDQFATHVPYLAAAAALVSVREDEPRIIELGAGEYSTPMLHAIVAACGGGLLTLDNSDKWLADYADLAKHFHELRVVSDWAGVSEIDEPWDLAFVDHAPAERRWRDVVRLAKSAAIVVVHDTEPFTAYGFDQARPEFRYVETCKRWRTWTSICSNEIDVTGFGAIGAPIGGEL